MVSSAKIAFVVSTFALQVAGLSNVGEIEEMLRATKRHQKPAARVKTGTGTGAGPFGRRQGVASKLRDEAHPQAWTINNERFHSFRAVDDCKRLADLLLAQEHQQEFTYPEHEQVANILLAWRSDRTAWEGGFRSRRRSRPRSSGLCLFNWRESWSRRAAFAFVRAELPFVIQHMPAVDRTVHTWTWNYLLRRLAHKPRLVEMSSSNQFLYWDDKKQWNQNGRDVPAYIPPSVKMFLPIQTWLQRATSKATQASWLARKADAKDSRVARAEHLYRKQKFAYYLLNSDQDPWLRYDLDLFDERNAPDSTTTATEDQESHIVEDKDEVQSQAALALGNASEAASPVHRGVHCRFAMPGTVAQAHFDAGRNFVALLRGHRRYILFPPSECSKLYLRNGTHPSARHSRVDFDAFSQQSPKRALFPLFGTAQATEVTLSPGHVLFIPSFWHHWISSTDISIQCNTRSGNPLQSKYRSAIRACGFP